MARPGRCRRCSPPRSATRRIISVVRNVFEDVLGPLYAAARYERMPLFEHYQFSPRLGPAVRSAVTAVTAGSGQKRLDFPGGTSLPNVCEFYEDFLAHHRLPAHDYHYVAYVHGDLNAANILIDSHCTTSGSSTFSTPRARAERFAKSRATTCLPADALLRCSPLPGALAITRALRSVADLQAELP